MGRRLAALLNQLIDAHDGDRPDVIANLGEAAGIEPGTVGQILDGSISCPPLERLQGFARALGVSSDRIVAAARADGCEYGATARNVALLQAQPLGGGVKPPEWIELLPAARFETADGRGPFSVEDMAALADASLRAAGGKLAIDENHSIDTAAKQGGASPARGWVVELAARGEGLWGRVEWTRAGRELLGDRAYRFISPVFTFEKKSGRVLALLRAALTNDPALPQLKALNAKQESTDMDPNELIKLLGLKDGADEKAICAAVEDLKDGADGAVKAALAPVAKAAGLKQDASAGEIVKAVETLARGAPDAVAVAGLQTELKAVAAELAEHKETAAREKAEAAIDKAIAEGRAGVKPLRDHYIERHMKNAADVEKELASLPSLTGRQLEGLTPPARGKDGLPGLDEDDKALCAQLGLDRKAYAETLAREAEAEGAL